jgi:uncharacterized membrane protein HdeD (DUF308 family)
MKTGVLVLLSLACVACAYGIASVVSAVAVANGASATTGWMLGGGVVLALAGTIAVLAKNARKAG